MRYRVIWMYHSTLCSRIIEASSPKEAARRVFLSFSKEFQQTGTVYAALEQDVTTVTASQFQHMKSRKVGV